MARKSLRSTLGNLAANRGGNFAITAAITIPLLAACTGLAVDYINLINSQRALQGALDAAAVSAAASMVTGHSDSKTVKDYATNMVMAQLGTLVASSERDEIRKTLVVTAATTSVGSVTTYDLKLSSTYSVPLTPFSKFLGYTSRPVAALSTTRSQSVSKSALSMYVVLDRSGSMSFVTDTLAADSKTKCQNYTASNWSQYPNLAATKPCYTNKSAALKTAAASLFDQLDVIENKDTKDTIVRTGGVSFTDTMQTPEPLAWGTTSMRAYVNNIPAYPSGGTDMTGGMNAAYKALIASSETTAQTSKGNTTFLKFIVLMTDGENTGASSSWNPALDTKTLATCDSARKAGITIFTVAFMAPANGISLLKSCAGVNSNAYVANDMASLVKAFADIGTKAVQKATRIVN